MSSTYNKNSFSQKALLIIMITLFENYEAFSRPLYEASKLQAIHPIAFSNNMGQVKKRNNPTSPTIFNAQFRLDEPPSSPNAPGTPSISTPSGLIPKVDDGKLDIMSRLLKDRIIMLGSQINDEVANALVAQMMYLASEKPQEDITFYINSPGGSVTSGMAIFDIMQKIPCNIETICFGTACSMAAFLLASGTPGRRKSLPNSRIMIHQPLGGAHGQASDIEIQAKEILFTRQLLNTHLSHFSGQPISKIEEDTDRNFFMTPFEAKSYGLIDEIIETKASHIQIEPMPTLI